MNCKPGDLCYLVAPFNAASRGRVVTVLRAARTKETFGRRTFYRSAAVGWVIVGPNMPKSVAADECLRPIRDPGDDAKDEILRPLPAPAEPVTT